MLSFVASRPPVPHQVEASRYQNLALVKQLIRVKGTPTNAPQRRTGWLPLVEAAKTGNMESTCAAGGEGRGRAWVGGIVTSFPLGGAVGSVAGSPGRFAAPGL